MHGDWPGADARPQRRDGAAAVDLDDNVALYDEGGQLLIMLNSTAAAVWRSCDGSATLDDIVRELVQAYGADEDVARAIRQDVRLTVRKLAELGLVEDAGHQGLPPR